VIAGGISAAVYKAAKLSYQATCVFQVSLPSTAFTGVTDVLTFQATQAAIETHRAASGNVFGAPAAAAGLDPAVAAKETTLNQSPGSPDFQVAVDDDSSSRAATLANALCDEYVKRVIALRQQERTLEISQLDSTLTELQNAVTSLNSIPAADRPPGTDAMIAARQRAIGGAEQVLAVALGSPPDNISVVTRSTGGVVNDTRDLARNVLVAGVAALLACFLIILVGEIVREPRTIQ
jgi:hypothetical protein